MDRIIVKPSGPLHGDVEINGAKNSALKVMAACSLAEGTFFLTNVPDITDVRLMSELLVSLGMTVRSVDTNSLEITNPGNLTAEAPYELVEMMRASIVVLGPLLARYGKARVALPGGDDFGPRPIDMHLRGLEMLGAKFASEHGYIDGHCERLRGSRIVLEFPSVGATENIMMAASIAKGKTIIENVAKEPEINDLAMALNKMGAKINVKNNGIIKIDGVNSLSQTSHKIMSDRIVAGTFVIAAVMLNKKFEVKDIESNHLEALTSSLTKMGAKLKIKKTSIQIMPTKKLNGIKIQTAPYPGFPTDLQAQIMALMSLVNGNSQIKENIFENRFMHVPELNRLGAKIRVKKDIALITGNRNLKGAQVMASDLRASVSLVLAALCAEGESVINRVYHLDRGYEKIEHTLGSLGPSIKREKY